LPVPPTNRSRSGVDAVLKRFMFASLAFVGLIVPGAWTASASGLRPQSRGGRGRDCGRADTRQRSHRREWSGNLQRHAGLYFLELVKARAVTALCRNGPERERDLGRFDADVAHINALIAARCLW